MIETPQQFGPEGSLVGMLTQPHEGDRPPVAFLFFNAGVIPRIGTHRLNVKIARELASLGQTSLRFDLSGQGDSRFVGGGDGDVRAQAVRDLGAAMDHLQQTLGIRRFALVGICSGAVNAFWASVADPRVVGVMMVDGLWFRSRWTTPVRHWKRLWAVPGRSVLHAILRRIPGLSGLAPASKHRVRDREGSGGALASGNPPRAEFVRALQSLADRRAAVFFVYGGSVIDYYSYAGQFRHAFAGAPFLAQVRCDFHPEIDHTFVALDVQQRMVALVRGWVPEVQRAGEGRA